MAFPKRNALAQKRSLDRREREDGAPRLTAEVPGLLTLQLSITDGEQGAIGGNTHVRHVVVPRAPALFEPTCSNPDCKEGGHDLTREILRSLQARETTFSGEDACTGNLGTGRCGYVLRYVATATYAPR